MALEWPITLCTLKASQYLQENILRNSSTRGKDAADAGTHRSRQTFSVTERTPAEQRPEEGNPGADAADGAKDQERCPLCREAQEVDGLLTREKAEISGRRNRWR